MSEHLPSTTPVTSALSHLFRAPLLNPGDSFSAEITKTGLGVARRKFAEGNIKSITATAYPATKKVVYTVVERLD